VAPPSSNWRSRSKRFLPWLGTAVLLSYLGFTTDIDTVRNSLAEVNIWAVLAVALVATVTTFVTDAWTVSRAFSRFVCPVTYREALPIKATSYFLNILNYNVALVGMAFYLQRSRQAPFWRSLGSLFFLNLVDILGLCVLLAVGLLATMGTDTLDGPTQALAWVMAAGGFGGFSLAVAVIKLNVRIPVISRILKLELLAPLADLDALTVVRFLGMRIALLLQYVASQYLLLQLFGIDVPVLRLLVYNSLLTFVQIVPISVSGLGTVQVVMRHFYAPYVLSATSKAAAVVDACSTTGIFGFIIFRILVAYLFLGELSRQIIRGAGASMEQPEGMES
jgi:uncharacterized membrane protein YbhN (UPF0104 family)